MAEKYQVSELHAERLKFKPVLPNVLKKGAASVKPVFGKATKSIADYDTVKSIFSHTYGMPVVSFQSGSNTAVTKKTVNIGVVLSGGQAAGEAVSREKACRRRCFAPRGNRPVPFPDRFGLPG